MTKTSPVVTTYKMFASNGRYIRTATKVTFADGRTVEFMDRMSKRDALKAAGR